MSANITNTPADKAPEVTATPGSERLTQTLRAQHRTRLAHDAPLVLAAHLLLIGVVLTLVWNHGHVTAWEWWGLAIMLTTVARAAWQRQARLATVRDEDILTGTRTLVLLQGLAWGIGSAFLVAELPVEHAAIVLVGMAGLMASAANTLVADPASFYLLIGSVYAPILASLVLTASDRDDMITAGMTAIYVYIMHTMHRRAYRALRRQIETNAAMEEKAALLESQVRASADGLLIVDGRGHKILQNQRFLDIWDIPPDIGTDLSDTRTLETALARLKDPKAFASRVAHLYNHPEEVSRDEIELLNGRVYDRFSAPVVGAGGAYYGRIWSFHDVTDLKRVAEAMREAKELAERTTKTRSMFLANMSHEIRTPMNAVLGLTELLLDEDLPAGQRHSLELIRSSGESLLSIINDVLDFSKIEAGRLDVEAIGFDLHHLVQNVVEALGVRAREKGVALTADVHSGTPVWVTGDPGRLRQVLTNLIGNAVKFTEKGAVTVRVAPDSGRGGKAGIGFAVRDTGIGIPAEKLTQIFQEFTQADGSTSRRFGGTGLGLTIAQRLVGLMGGQIAVTSEVGKGSEFTFALPLAAAAAQEAPGSTRPSPRAARHLRVLLAEDNSVNQEVAATMLRRRGHQVDVVGDGRAAVAAAERTLYDVVLMDVQMPEMDGYEATAAIRRLPCGGTLPIIALTAHALTGERERCLEHGMDGYLAKPVKAQELFHAVETGKRVQAHHDRPRADLLETFLATAPERVSALDSALVRGTSADVTRAAHALRSSAGAVGADSFEALLGDLEAEGGAGTLTERPAWTGLVNHAASEVLTDLRACQAGG